MQQYSEEAKVGVQREEHCELFPKSSGSPGSKSAATGEDIEQECLVLNIGAWAFTGFENIRIVLTNCPLI